MNDADVAALFAEAARAWHPTLGPLHVLESRVARLEREVAYLRQRLAMLARLLATLEDMRHEH